MLAVAPEACSGPFVSKQLLGLDQRFPTQVTYCLLVAPRRYPWLVVFLEKSAVKVSFLGR